MAKHFIDNETRLMIGRLYVSGEKMNNISVLTGYSFPVLTRILKEDGYGNNTEEQFIHFITKNNYKTPNILLNP